MNNKEIEERWNELSKGMEKEFGIKNEYKIKAIGYLEHPTVYEVGEVPKGFIEKLKQVYHSGIVLASMGHHDCDFCIHQGVEPAKSSSEKTLRDEENKIEYILPEMIFHYITVHKFVPSKEFIDFIMGYDKYEM